MTSNSGFPPLSNPSERPETVEGRRRRHWLVKIRQLEQIWARTGFHLENVGIIARKSGVDPEMQGCSAMSAKRTRRLILFAIVVGAALYFVPIPTVILFVCGALDVGRHRKITYELLERYFAGNGVGTWFLSPVNLIADLLSHRNKGRYALADLPPAHREEIEACVRALNDNSARFKAHIAKTMGQNKRSMLTFKWYDAKETTDLNIPAFEKEYHYIKTIALSVFNTRERTSWHFGPLRLTFRVLYNLDPLDSRDVFIEVDDQVHYWKDDPLFIFDDTMFHRSINDADHIRYCLFMDIVRPNHVQSAFDVAVQVVSIISGSLKRVFYKNWSFVR